eukprot:m.361726 g.361726  ORF g.361726 m.361726 type:complete len:144 (+) comp19843_c0_seq1:209-640(+)
MFKLQIRLPLAAIGLACLLGVVVMDLKQDVHSEEAPASVSEYYVRNGSSPFPLDLAIPSFITLVLVDVLASLIRRRHLVRDITLAVSGAYLAHVYLNVLIPSIRTITKHTDPAIVNPLLKDVLVAHRILAYVLAGMIIALFFP